MVPSNVVVTAQKKVRKQKGEALSLEPGFLYVYLCEFVQ